MKPKLLSQFLIILVITIKSFNLTSESEPHLKQLNKTENKISEDDVCDSQLALFTEALHARELWALKFFDTWGKINSGYLEGNKFSLGSYTECLRFRHTTKHDNNLFRGKYCMVVLIPQRDSSAPHRINENAFGWKYIGELAEKLQMHFIQGICVPHSCSPSKAENYFRKILIEADLSAHFVSCRTGDQEFKTIDIAAFSVFSIFFALLVSSTAYDLVMRDGIHEPNNILVSFSIYSNGQKLFAMSKNNSPNVINCLNGLRALSVFWIIFGHRFRNQQAYPVTNQEEIKRHNEHFYSVILSVYNIAVDTFLVMGSMLVTTSTLNALDKKTLNVPRMILHRYLRYTPALAAVVLFNVTFYGLLCDGPIAPRGLKEKCMSNWWTALLHIQNYVDTKRMCAGHTWYLSADFQLFVISPFLIYPAFRLGWKYLWTLPALAIGSSVYVLITCLTSNYRVLSRFDVAVKDEFNKQIYYPTHARMGPWLAGIVLGYTLFSYRNKKIVIGKKVNMFLWILAISTLAAVMLLAQPLNVPDDNKTSPIFNAIYIAFHRLAWAVAICWIIFACHKLKTGGIIRWFLSLPQWQPISRMSLSIYLIHPVYQNIVMHRQKVPMSFELWSMFHLFLGDIVVGSILGSAMYLTFESPFHRIEELVVNANFKPQETLR